MEIAGKRTQSPVDSGITSNPLSSCAPFGQVWNYSPEKDYFIGGVLERKGKGGFFEEKGSS
ncbi:hypothetical protein AKJ58_00395 [candidate division MSBL1 archaeon SCGC-AAA385D11]|uniref:Uncharacterized protein n=1 Tax=candidate division MSBL1 archaeon SCGC-AAA385D11 TaxID=1698286 RepID=A0A133VPG0_9EURY|nr:hypothetical protein AKJ58_00395 [candidate division MSBL1 archaeon SCGC-AAA385D11]